MKTVTELAREAGIDWDELEDYSEYRVSALELQRFATLIIEQEHKRLLDGSGEPVAEVSALYGGAKYQLLPTQDYYTADQLAAAEQAPQPTSLTSLLKHKDVQAALLAAQKKIPE